MISLIEAKVGVQEQEDSLGHKVGLLKSKQGMQGQGFISFEGQWP